MRYDELLKSEEKNIGEYARVRKHASLELLEDKESVEVLGQYGKIVDKEYIDSKYGKILIYHIKFDNGKTYRFHRGHIDYRWRYSGIRK